MPISVLRHLNYCRPYLRDPRHTIGFTTWRHDRYWRSLIDENKVIDELVYSGIEMFTNTLRVLAAPAYGVLGSMVIIIDEPEPQWLRDNTGLLEALKARASFNIYVVTTAAETEQALLG